MKWVVYVVQIKPAERVLNAEAHQLIQEALAARRPDERFYYKALAALGRRLIVWGEWLQNQYDAARHTPLELPSWDVVSRD